jgi:hypothetical protein
MHSFVLMGVVTILWSVIGYSMAFGEWMPFIGGGQYAFMNGVGAAPNPDYGATIPHQTYMIYQLMFAIITPALISGAFAERMRFSGMLLFMTLWSLLVYFPMAHMVWGKGGLLNAALGGKVPAFDFAGGTVVARYLGCVCACLRAVPRPPEGTSIRADAAAQPGIECYRRLPAVGGVVRVQRGQRRGGVTAGFQRLRGNALCHSRGGHGLDVH